MVAQAGPAEEEAFAKRVWRRALDSLVETRVRGEDVFDEGDFIAREIDEAYRERARRAPGEDG